MGKRKILIFFYESFLSVSLVLLTSCTYIPMSYRITDVIMQRIMLDSDSDSEYLLWRATTISGRLNRFYPEHIY